MFFVDFLSLFYLIVWFLELVAVVVSSKIEVRNVTVFKICNYLQTLLYVPPSSVSLLLRLYSSLLRCQSVVLHFAYAWFYIISRRRVSLSLYCNSVSIPVFTQNISLLLALIQKTCFPKPSFFTVIIYCVVSDDTLKLLKVAFLPPSLHLII